MASVRDVTCAGLMLTRKLDGKFPNINMNSGGDKGDKGDKNKQINAVGEALGKLQMALLENIQGHFALPSGRIGPDENEMVAAQRVTQEATGYTAADYQVFQQLSFVMDDLSSECKKTIYWIAVLNEPGKEIHVSPAYKNNFWLDFDTIKTLGQSAIGKLQNNLKTLFDKFTEVSSSVEQVIHNKGVNV